MILPDSSTEVFREVVRRPNKIHPPQEIEGTIIIHPTASAMSLDSRQMGRWAIDSHRKYWEKRENKPLSHFHRVLDMNSKAPRFVGNAEIMKPRRLKPLPFRFILFQFGKAKMTPVRRWYLFTSTPVTLAAFLTSRLAQWFKWEDWDYWDVAISGLACGGYSLL